MCRAEHGRRDADAAAGAVLPDQPTLDEAAEEQLFDDRCADARSDRVSGVQTAGEFVGGQAHARVAQQVVECRVERDRDDDGRGPADDRSESADADVRLAETPAEVATEVAGAASFAHVEDSAEQPGPEHDEADEQLSDVATGVARRVECGESADPAAGT